MAQYLPVADATFISHVREDVPWLIAEVERLRGIVSGDPDALFDLEHLAALRAERDALKAELENQTKRGDGTQSRLGIYRMRRDRAYSERDKAIARRVEVEEQRDRERRRANENAAQLAAAIAQRDALAARVAEAMSLLNDLAAEHDRHVGYLIVHGVYDGERVKPLAERLAALRALAPESPEPTKCGVTFTWASETGDYPDYECGLPKDHRGQHRAIGEAHSCPHGNPTCPCPDGLACHYEGPDAIPCLTTGAAPCLTCRVAPESPEPTTRKETYMEYQLTSGGHGETVTILTDDATIQEALNYVTFYAASEADLSDDMSIGRQEVAKGVWRILRGMTDSDE